MLRSIALPITLLFFAFFYNLGAYPLMDNNEGLYASIALSMLQTGEWILPKLNGVLYLEKPPMLYWLTALSFKLFGVGEGSARLVPALSGFGLCIYMMFFLRGLQGTRGQFHDNHAWLSAPLIFGSSIVLLVISRTVYFDMLFCLMFSVSLCSFYLWTRDDKQSHLYVAYISLALATLTKGLMAPVLAALIMVSYCVAAQIPFSKMIRVKFNYGFAIFLILVVPWHVAAYYQHNDFAWYYFVNEHWNRFLDQRIPADYYTGPWHYYLPRILGYLVPWTGALIFLIKTYRTALSDGRSLRLFASIWFIVVLLFFSVSRAKANYYMVLGMPALVMLIAMGIQLSTSRRALMLHKVFVLSFAGIFATAALSIGFDLDLIRHDKISPFVDVIMGINNVGPYAFGILGVYLVIMILTLLSKRQFNLAKLNAGVGIFSLCIATHLAPHFSNEFSSKQALNAVPAGTINSGHLYLFKDFEFLSAISFYAKQPIPVIDSGSSDLLYGQQQNTRPDLFPSFEEIEAKRNYDEEQFIITRPSYTHVLENKGYCLKQDFGKRQLFSSLCDS